MRPVSVAFDCFGPYLDHQEVDFRTLARDGLFLIRGETGAGKTTVLDAICCALYGQSSNGNGKDEGAGRGGLEDMRCRSASPSQETRVSFVFEQDGTQYYFERHIRVTRLGTLSAVEASCGVGTPEKPERVLASKPTAVSQEAEALIGLRVDQFRQVILLPQGKFQKLLVSDPEEKRKIISSLFNTGRLKKAAELFRQEVTDEQHRLESERGQIEAGLRRWECGTCADLAAACAEREAAIAGLRGDEAGQKKRLEAAHEALTLASQTEERFAALDKASQQLSGMLASAAEQERRVRGAELAARAAAAEEAHDALLLAERTGRRLPRPCGARSWPAPGPRRPTAPRPPPSSCTAADRTRRTSGSAAAPCWKTSARPTHARRNCARPGTRNAACCPGPKSASGPPATDWPGICSTIPRRRKRRTGSARPMRR